MHQEHAGLRLYAGSCLCSGLLRCTHAVAVCSESSRFRVFAAQHWTSPAVVTLNWVAPTSTTAKSGLRSTEYLPSTEPVRSYWGGSQSTVARSGSLAACVCADLAPVAQAIRLWVLSLLAARLEARNMPRLQQSLAYAACAAVLRRSARGPLAHGPSVAAAVPGTSSLTDLPTDLPEVTEARGRQSRRRQRSHSAGHTNPDSL